MCQKNDEEIKWEVIIVDNGENEGLKRICELSQKKNYRVPFTIVKESRKGLSYARQKGITTAKFDVLCFVDDDNWVDQNWIHNLFRLMEKYPEIGACGGVSEPVFEVAPPVWFERFKASYAVGEQGQSFGEVDFNRDFLWGAGLAIRKKALDDLYNNGFQQLLIGRKGRELNSGEDSEICFALKLSEWCLWYSPSLKLKHYISQKRLNWQYLRKLHFGFGSSKGILRIYTNVLSSSYSEKIVVEKKMFGLMHSFLLFESY